MQPTMCDGHLTVSVVRTPVVLIAWAGQGMARQGCKGNAGGLHSESSESQIQEQQQCEYMVHSRVSCLSAQTIILIERAAAIVSTI